MTMGTSIIVGSLGFTFTFHTPPRYNAKRARGELKWSARLCRKLRGLAIQKFEGLFAADSVPDSIEAPILCQTCADRFRSLFALLGEGGNLVIQFVLSHFDFFQIRNAFQ